MNELLNLLSRYGYLLIFANLFLESVGLPIPAAPILVAAGAAAAFGSLKILNVLMVALAACMLGDLLLYPGRSLHGLGDFGFLVPPFGKSRNLHFEVRRIVLQARPIDSRIFKISTRYQHHGPSHGG